MLIPLFVYTLREKVTSSDESEKHSRRKRMNVSIIAESELENPTALRSFDPSAQ
jgi:hypothetical protein